MKPLSDSLPGAVPERSGEEEASDLPVDATCPKCKGAGWLRFDVYPGDPRFGQIEPCPCSREDLEARRIRKLVEGGQLGTTLRQKLFSTYRCETPEQEEAFAAARKFAETPEGWLVLSGPLGVGKTHLVAAIANARIELGFPVLFETVPYLLDRLRFSYKDDADFQYQQLLETVMAAGILILDDLGAQTSTPWAQEKLYQILNHRYNKAAPTVITTNLPPGEIEPRLRSRVCSPDLSTVVHVRGKGKAEQQRFPGGTN